MLKFGQGNGSKKIQINLPNFHVKLKTNQMIIQ